MTQSDWTTQPTPNPPEATSDTTHNRQSLRDGLAAVLQSDSRLHVYIAIITTVLVIWAMRMATPVVLPVIFALFLIALFWPLLRRLQEHMPRSLAMAITFLVLLLVLGIFVAAFWYSGSRISAKATDYTETFTNYINRIESVGIDIPGLGSNEGGDSGSSFSSLQDLGMRLVEGVLSSTSAFVLTIAYLMLGLLEVRTYKRKLTSIIPGADEDRWFGTIERIAHDFQRYIIIRTGVGLLNGVLAGVGLWLLGVDFAFTWGLLTFLLNYIPTIGSVIATVPPPLFALVQFDGYGMALATLLLVGGLQLVLGVYVDPLIQGRYLSPSPLIVLISVTFWGWLWGGTGAFIAVPLTILIILACRQYERTAWIAKLLAGEEELDAIDVDAQQSRSKRADASAAEMGT